MDHTLRLYRNPFKQLLLLLTSLGFVAIGMWMLTVPKVRADTPLTVTTYLILGFFGLGVVVFLVSLARALLVQRPMLQVARTAGRMTLRLDERRGMLPGRISVAC